MTGAKLLSKFIILLLLLIASVAAANPSPPQAEAEIQSKNSSTSLHPELLGAKTLLEDLLARRYSQELASQIDRQAFSLSAQLELKEMAKEANDLGLDDDSPADLFLGNLDPESLLKKYPLLDGASSTQGFLKNYRIQSVYISVGLKENLTPETKAQVEKWLHQRLNLEFANNGKGTVSFIREESAKPMIHPKTFLEWLSQYQTFAGQLVLALAILLGTLLWKALSSSDKITQSGDSTSQPSTTQTSQPAASSESIPVVPPPTESDHSTKIIPEDFPGLSSEIKQLNEEIHGLSLKLSDSEQLIRTWCQSGEEGLLKIACFAEVAGKELGKLSIPIDLLPKVSEVFLRMPELSLKDKRNALQKAYWDILAILNLGPESLQQPFSYLGGMKINLINQVLMNQNPKMKALVSLYMPTDLRTSYLQTLNSETKKALIQSTAELTEVSVEELNSVDTFVKGKIQPGTRKNLVSLGQGLQKIVQSMTKIEEITLLQKMTGPAFEDYKRSIPSLAFIGSWKDEYLNLLISRASNDEILAYLRVNPELQEKILSLSSPMVVEVVSDELSRPDTTQNKDKNALLSTFTKRIEQLVKNKEIDLEQAFENPNSNLPSSKKETEESDDLKQAA